MFIQLFCLLFIVGIYNYLEVTYNMTDKNIAEEIKTRPEQIKHIMGRNSRKDNEQILENIQQ